MNDGAAGMATAPMLREERAGGVVTLTLNRPAQFNALSAALLAELEAACSRIAADPAARVVVLAAAGKAFCAGHDLREVRALPDAEAAARLFADCSRMMLRLRALPQPVIARVHGIATAAGCQLVAMCDLAVASEEARFAVSGIQLGLFCGTPSVPLSRNVPAKAAFEMLVTGDTIDARTALQRGLVNRVVPAAALDDEIASLAASIATKPASAIAIGKQLFYRQLEMGIAAAYQLAGQAMACNLQEADTREGIAAFVEKRPPAWAPAGPASDASSPR